MVGERLSRALEKIPKGPLGYVGDGRTTGMVGDLIRDTMEAYLPTAPTDVEIDHYESVKGGNRYFINVVGIVPKISEVRAILEALPGKINLATEDVEVENVEVISDRPMRKTFRVTVFVSE